MRVLENTACLQTIKYMGRVAQIIGRHHGLPSTHFKHSLHTFPTLQYDLRMMDSGHVFRRVSIMHCQPCEEREPDEPEVGYRPLQLVKQ